MNYAQQQRRPAKYFVGIALVVLLHVLLIYGLMNGLARKMVEVIKNPLEAKLIEEFKPPPPPPEKAPPPPPKAPPPPPEFVPRAEVTTTSSAPASVNAITAVSNTPPAPTPEPVAVVAPAPKPNVRVAPVIDSAANCKKPVYPAASAREEEQGTVVLGFLVGRDGKVIQSQVQSSSGFARLDEAARSALSLCTFKPGTLDGVPEEARASMKYTWRLE